MTKRSTYDTRANSAGPQPVQRGDAPRSVPHGEARGRGGAILSDRSSSETGEALRPQTMQNPNQKPTFDLHAAPAHLSAEARSWWDRIEDAYDLGPEHLLPLREALEAFDRCEAARKQIEADGLTLEDRFGQKRPNPLLAIERDSRNAFLRAWKQIGLDIEPPGPVGYPAGRPRGAA